MYFSVPAEESIVTGLSLILLHGFALAFMYTRDKYILQSSRRHFACEVVHTNGDSLTSNREGFVPRLVNDHPIKAWNQWEHKRMKELKKLLPKNDQERFTRQIVSSPV